MIDLLDRAEEDYKICKQLEVCRMSSLSEAVCITFSRQMKKF